MAIRLRPATPADAPALAALGMPADPPAWLAIEGARVHAAVRAGVGEGMFEAVILGIGGDRWDPGVGLPLWEQVCAGLAGLGARAVVVAGLPGDQRQRWDAGGLPNGRVPLPDLPFVQGFARAYDQDQGLERYLDPDALWGGPGPGSPGAALVLAGLRGRSAAPPDALAAMVRESTVAAVGGGRYRLQVAERLREAGHAHTFRHGFVLTLPEGRGINKVVPVDLPGEPARLGAFLRKVGVVRGG